MAMFLVLSPSLIACPASLGGVARVLASVPPGEAHNPNAWLSLVFLAAGLALFVMVMSNMFRKRARAARERASDPAHDAAPKDRLEAIRRAAEQHDRLSTLMVDVEQLTRRCAAQLDNKAERLELLIEQADERIAALRASQGGASAASDRRERARPEPEAPSPDPLTAEVYRLADQGRSPVEIAGAVQQPTGTVELILNLRRA